MPGDDDSKIDNENETRKKKNQQSDSGRRGSNGKTLLASGRNRFKLSVYIISIDRIMDFALSASLSLSLPSPLSLSGNHHRGEPPFMTGHSPPNNTDETKIYAYNSRLYTRCLPTPRDTKLYFSKHSNVLYM